MTDARKPRHIWVLEFNITGTWEFCEPIVAESLEAPVIRAAEQRRILYPNTKYRAMRYTSKREKP